MPPRARAALVIAVALLIPVIPFVVIGELPGEQWLSAAGDDALVFGLIGGGLLAADVLLPVPSSIIGTLLGARLGFVPGLFWAWSGLMLGALVGYGVGRLLLGRLGERLPQAPTLALLLLSRPVPVLAEAVTVTAGAERLSLPVFLAVCAAGNLVYAGALTASGAAFLPTGLAGPGLAIPLAVPALGWLIWRRVEHQGSG
ncbi:hypothetical protein [Thiohalocapsa halophila]|uniref:hypothetical protein n=1 Tax=Thiohalocapsa halophila TaxID=69359 RepID=UPI0019084219|nr:hypothetical protein [Thiohalocapsa halophila]